jgi:hypothetical protein
MGAGHFQVEAIGALWARGGREGLRKQGFCRKKSGEIGIRGCFGEPIRIKDCQNGMARPLNLKRRDNNH